MTILSITIHDNDNTRFPGSQESELRRSQRFQPPPDYNAATSDRFDNSPAQPSTMYQNIVPPPRNPAQVAEHRRQLQIQEMGTSNVSCCSDSPHCFKNRHINLIRIASALCTILVGGIIYVVFFFLQN
jgi:hypothetical protein